MVTRLEQSAVQFYSAIPPLQFNESDVFDPKEMRDQTEKWVRENAAHAFLLVCEAATIATFASLVDSQPLSRVLYPSTSLTEGKTAMKANSIDGISVIFAQEPEGSVDCSGAWVRDDIGNLHPNCVEKGSPNMRLLSIALALIGSASLALLGLKACSSGIGR